MAKVRSKKALFCALTLVALVACPDTNLLQDASFDQWCGEKLCQWTTDEGAIKRVATWHERDYGVGLMATPTQISQLSKASVSCLRFDMIADVAPEARVSLKLDFNDDGLVDFEQAVPSVSWRSLEFVVNAPVAYHSLRYILRKEGEGRAVVAQLRATEDHEACTGAPITLQTGSVCDSDESCKGGACLDGICSACGEEGTCAEGSACHDDGHCADGACVGDVCRACGKDGSCAVDTTCDAHAECASGACIPDEKPEAHQSVADQKYVCSECSEGVQCGEGSHCLSGVCVACRDDGDCAEGELCRWQDTFDTGPRTCVKEAPPQRPRGALCDVAADCADQLPCAAGQDMLKRCGTSCLREPWVCASDDTCVARGAELPLLNECWSEDGSLEPLCTPVIVEGEGYDKTENRVFTCFPVAQVGGACEPSAPCEGGRLCCDGVCQGDDVWECP